jgi:hypothetical protein
MNYFLNKTGFLFFDERYEEIDFSKTKAFFVAISLTREFV